MDVFHEYVRPVLNPQLTEYCINLTGIRQVRRMAGCRASRVLKLIRGYSRVFVRVGGCLQETVDKSDPFPRVSPRTIGFTTSLCPPS